MLRPGLFRKVLAIALCVIPALWFAAAQASHTGLKYDHSQETRVKGVVEEVRVEKFQELLVTLDGDSAKSLGVPKVIVQVAPDAFLKEMDITFAQGEKIEVLGCKVTADTDVVIMVREITRSSGTMSMRDERGVPVWQGWNPMRHD